MEAGKRLTQTAFIGPLKFILQRVKNSCTRVSKS